MAGGRPRDNLTTSGSTRLVLKGNIRPAQMSRPTQRLIQIPVKGMHCAGCRSKVEGAIAGEGVLESSVSLLTRSAIAKIDPALTTAGAIADRVRSLGYAVDVAEARIEFADADAARLSAATDALLDLDGIIWARQAGSLIECQLFSDYAGAAVITDKLIQSGLAPVSVRVTTPSRGSGGEASGAAGQTWQKLSDSVNRLVDLIPQLPAWAGPTAGLIAGLLVFWGQSSWLPIAAPGPLNDLVLLTAITLAVYLALGWDFHQSALRSFRSRSLDMYALVSMSTTAALAWSLYELAASWSSGNPPGELFLAEAALVIAIVSAGQALQTRALAITSNQYDSLLELVGAGQAMVEFDGEIRQVEVRQLRPGDIQVVRPGDQIALDGEVVSGQSTVDESLLTGEAQPILKQAGDRVIGSSQNHNGALRVKISRACDRSILAQIVREVELTQSQRVGGDAKIAKITAVYIPVVTGIAVLAALAWLILAPEAGVAGAIRTLFAVLVVACPCAIGLAIPSATVVGVSLGVRNGILLRDWRAVDSGREFDVLLLDKTGTITLGRPQVKGIELHGDTDRTEALALASAVEGQSEHPIGEAIRRFAHQQGVAAAGLAAGFAADFGGGVSATIDGKSVLAGSPGYLLAAGIPAPTPNHSGQFGIAMLAVDGAMAATFFLEDEIRPEANYEIANLKSRGIKPVLVTGDRSSVAQPIAAAVGISEVFADQSPTEKAQIARQYRSNGQRVAMVGDGVNDAPALAQADLGIAVGTGSDLASHAADISILAGGLERIAGSMDLVSKLRFTINVNLALAFSSTVVLIVLATGVFYPVLGYQFNPALAALAMAVSTLLVLANSLRLGYSEIVKSTTR